MRVVTYALVEAVRSLWRRRRPAALAVLTISVAVMLLGVVLIVTQNASELVRRWEASSEMSVFLHDGVDAADGRAVEEALRKSGVAASIEHLTKAAARERFQRDFEDLAGIAATLDTNPFPASFEGQ